MSKTIILVNPDCHQKKGWKRWLSIRDDVYRYLPDSTEEIVLEKGDDLKQRLIPLLQQEGEKLLISAGGDGTIHYLVNTLCTLPEAERGKVVVGAIGLGSSNDFLKPFGERIQNIPVRINHKALPVLHDVGVALYTNGDDKPHTKYFIVNASFGLTAEGNRAFNNPGIVLRWLKKYMTEAAIAYSAMQTLVRYRNQRCIVSYYDKTFETSISNLNVLKVPYVAGSFYYKQEIKKDDGQLRVNLSQHMTKREILSLMSRLQKGRFPQTSKTLSVSTSHFTLTSSQPVVFECDGETEQATRVELSVLPRAINVLNA